MDYFLRLVRRTGVAAQFCEYALLWNGVCGDGRHGLGVVDKLDLYSMCCDGYGGVV